MIFRKIKQRKRPFLKKSFFFNLKVFGIKNIIFKKNFVIIKRDCQNKYKLSYNFFATEIYFFRYSTPTLNPIHYNIIQIFYL
jgi:hypothetical protein